MKINNIIVFALLLGISIRLNAQSSDVIGMKEGMEVLQDSLEGQFTNLDEIVIAVKKDIVKSDGATLTYDLENDNSSKGSTLLEALKKVPMVTVDGQDNIYIKGSSNFRVYVNGKEDAMLTANASTVFKSMPADAISKIEVITEPGAKYDAEGVGGILNLVTERKQRKDGYSGSVGISGGAKDLGANLFGRMKYNKFSMDASFNYMNNYLQKQQSRSKGELINLISDDYYLQKLNQDQRLKYGYYGANLNFAWEPTDKDILSWGGSVTAIKADLNYISVLTEMYNRYGALQYSFLNHANGYLNNVGVNGNIGYRHIFNDQGSLIRAGYGFNYNSTNLHLNYHNQNIYNYDEIMEYKKYSDDEFVREHTATIDYELPISENHKLETGIKGIFRHNGAIGEMREGNSEQNLIYGVEDDSKVRQIQNIYSGYCAYDGTYGPWSVKAGLRYEHTYMGMDFLIGEMPDFRRRLNDIVPNGAATYSFGPATNLRLAYQMRISRPGINMLNPFELHLIETMVQTGNPDLKSEKYHNITLTYSNYGRILGGNVSLDLSESNNTIESYNYFKEGITYSTYGNLGINKLAGLTGFINWNISSRMSASVNGGIRYNYFKSTALELKNHGWTFNYGANCNYTGPGGIKYNVYGGQSTRNYNLQGYNGGWYYYGISISKDFLAEKNLTLAVNASNFLTKYLGTSSYTKMDSQISKNRWEMRNWNVGISINWRFGKLKDNTKNAGVSLDNDDMKQSGKNGFGL